MDPEDFFQFISGIANMAAWFAPAILFIVFLILFIVNLIKFRKERMRKYKVRTIVFGCISGYFLLTVAGEIFLIGMLAAAVSHM